MTDEHADRIAAALERIAAALEGVGGLTVPSPAPPVDAAFLAEGVRSLGLSYRVQKSLFRPRHPELYPVIATVGELVALTAEELMERGGFGKWCLAHVRTKLAAKGLKLRGD
jgi:hypothetical protein